MTSQREQSIIWLAYSNVNMQILKVLFCSAVNHPSACEPGIMINFDNSICSNCPFLSLNTNIALIYFFPLYTHVEWNFLFCVFYPAYFLLFHFLFFFLCTYSWIPQSPHTIFFSFWLREKELRTVRKLQFQ